MGTWPHVRIYRILGFTDKDMEPFPCLLGWISRIAARSAVQEGISGKYTSEKNPSAVVRGGLDA
jgi:hypothetical protein